MNLLICSPSSFSDVFERLCESYDWACTLVEAFNDGLLSEHQLPDGTLGDRKSTRLNSSH